MGRMADQVKLFYLWFSHVDRLISFVALQCKVGTFNLVSSLL